MYQSRKNLFDARYRDLIEKAKPKSKAEIKGNLQFISLGTLISLNCNESRTARLEIKNNNTQADIYLNKGNISHASIDSETGEEAFYKILKIKNGNFNLYPDEKAPVVSINTNWSSLLLEGTRRMDENSANQDEKVDWDNFVIDESGVERIEKIDEQVESMVEALSRLEQVVGVSVVTYDSKILTSEGDFDSDDYAEYVNAVANTGQKLGGYLGTNYFNHAQIAGSQDTFVINRGQDSVVIVTKDKKNHDSLLEKISTIIKKYR